MRLSLYIAFAAVLSARVACRASDITYNFIPQTIGTYHAEGTVTTDGTIGILATADIVAFTITVSNGGVTDTFSNFSNPSTVSLKGPDLTATNSGLFFNFGDTDSNGFAMEGPGVITELCFVAQGATCSGVPGSIEIAVGNSLITSATLTGVQEIATVAPTTTPEPSSIALLGSALLFTAGFARRYNV